VPQQKKPLITTLANLDRFIQEAQLLPCDRRDALYQLKYRCTVVQLMQTDHMITCQALSATATNNHDDFLILKIIVIMWHFKGQNFYQL